ncbi:MAG: AAA family ATPase [Candidatus Eiseniibacteriota bacterium]|nr:MAG: AAA family ATPase [Candidatus Eisenbacteria bacterium]
MKITKVDIQGFGTFSTPRSFSFRDNVLNIVFGGNESGKSTLMEAIYATLFGFQKKETEERYESWLASEDYTGAVEFALGGGPVRFFRDFSSNKVTVSRSEGGKETELFRGEASPRSRREERRGYNEVLRELLGFSDGELARRTSFVGQKDLETKFTPALRGLISGAGSADYHEAIQILRERFADITTQNPWGSARRRKRALEKSADELEAKRAELRQAESLFQESSKLAEERSKLEKERTRLVQERDAGHRFLTKLHRLVQLQGKLRGKQERYDSEQRAKAGFERARKACDEAEEKLEQEHSLFSRLGDDTLSAIDSTLSRGASAEESLTGREKELAGLQAVPVGGRRPFPAWVVAVAPVVSFLLLSALGIALGKAGQMFILAILVSVFLALGLWLFFRAGRRPSSDLTRKVEELDKQVATLKDEIRSLSEEAWRLFPEQVRPSLQRRSLSELSTQYADFVKARKGLQELKHRLLSPQSEDAEETHADALKELAVAQSQLEEFLRDEKELLPLKDEPERATRMATEAERRANEADSKLKELEEGLKKIEIELAGLSTTTLGSPETYREEIEWLEKKLLRLKERRDALRLGVDTLVKCVEEYQAESTSRISSRISELFSMVTGGRYNAVDLSSEEVPSLSTDSRTDIDVSEVSTGTEDQLYFCMRVAMLEELSGEKGLPLILDDPFVNFDDRRLERARQLLRDLMGIREMQIILFTHENRHLDQEAHVIRLAQP